jgi:hypothetical protein
MNTLHLAGELVNDNSISAIALTFFTALLGLMSIIAKGVFDTRKTTREAKSEAGQANESAQAAQANTTNISNGFAGTVVRKLDTIEGKTDDLSKAFREHLEWHINKETHK